ncbi:MAG: radical SAM protein [Clostridia bacterium]|nr:radical SAM protein [Clostridia bacterium]
MIKDYSLRVLLFEVTQKCNAKCDHCGSRCDIDSEELLTAEEILACLRDVKENIGTDVMINISGGEPLMRKDLFEIMTEGSGMGFDWGMVTNGVLISDAVIEKMKTSGMKTITISLDGLRETHESLRHLPGSYDVILRNLRKLKDADFLDHIQVTFTSNSRNVREFPALYEELDKIGLDSIRTSIVDPIGRAEDNLDLAVSAEDIKFITDFIVKVNAQHRTPVVWGCPHFLGNLLPGRDFDCFAGIHAASVLYNGDIFVCPNVPRKDFLIQGNIKTDSFSEKWKNGFEYFRNRPVSEKCKGCEYFDKCVGDSLHTWDFEKNEPRFCYRDTFSKTADYKDYIRIKYPELGITEISGEDVGEVIYIEPDAYKELRSLFHMGRRNPYSMYEQQAGLVGFRTGDSWVVKYVFPSLTVRINEDTAKFASDTLKHAVRETEIIRKNFPYSDDRDDFIGDGLVFLGFAHSHPLQRELQYSTGDENIHNYLMKKLGHYMGILINPEEDLIGAYSGKEIKQAGLRIIE